MKMCKNIEEYNWVEASGSVEKTFKMHNAYILPNKYVEQILGKNVNLCEDGFHYQRVIGNDNEVFTKIIFGINSEDLLNTSELCEDLLSIIQPLEIICKKAIEVINKEERVA